MPNLDRDYYLDKEGLQTLISELETNLVAEEYDSSTAYTVGQFCIYENNLYRCISATTGTWDSTKWDKVIITDELHNGVSYLRVVNGAVNIVYDDGT